MEEVYLKFWGVRGSRPVTGTNTIKYGGNTACVEVRIEDQLIILDAGTGICNLGNKLIKNTQFIQANIFITHTHWDHILGIPFFKPIYKNGNNIYFYGTASENITFKEQVTAIMKHPYFPIEFKKLKSNCNFIELNKGDSFILEGKESPITINTFSNYHPNGGISYQICYQNKKISYVTDIECVEMYTDLFCGLVEFVRGSDVFIFDANYTNKEYFGDSNEASKIGWGHSTWETGLAIALEAKVKNYYIFHHDPERKDEDLDIIQNEANKLFSRAYCAREGEEIYA